LALSAATEQFTGILGTTLSGADFEWVGASGNTYGLYKTPMTWGNANVGSQRRKTNPNRNSGT